MSSALQIQVLDLLTLSQSVTCSSLAATASVRVPATLGVGRGRAALHIVKPPPNNLAPEKPTRDIHAYRMDAELADGVIHQNHAILHAHTDVPIGPAALVWPVLVALFL